MTPKIKSFPVKKTKSKNILFLFLLIIFKIIAMSDTIVQESTSYNVTVCDNSWRIH